MYLARYKIAVYADGHCQEFKSASDDSRSHIAFAIVTKTDKHTNKLVHKLIHLRLFGSKLHHFPDLIHYSVAQV